MKRLIFLFLFIFSIGNVANASCQWAYVNALYIDITHAREQLSTYSTCRGNCKSLESNLDNSIAKMSKASACGAHIYTRTNKDLINFIAGRFRLIQKQKQGSTWTMMATKKVVVDKIDDPVDVPTKMDEPNPQAQAMVVPVVKPVVQVQARKQVPVEPVPQARTVAVPRSKSVVQQTKMTLSREAYEALWDVAKPRRAPQRNFQRAVIRKPRVVNNTSAKQKHLARQRLIQHRKQALLQQKKMHLMKTKRRAMQNHLNQQRLLRKQLLKRRELARQLNRERVQQRRRAMALRKSQ